MAQVATGGVFPSAAAGYVDVSPFLQVAHTICFEDVRVASRRLAHVVSSFCGPGVL